MPRENEFLQPKGNKLKEAQEAVKTRLLKHKRERELSEVFRKFHPLDKDRNILEFFTHEEWNTFLKNFTEIIKALLLLNSFEEDLALKTECEQVLILLNQQDVSQSKRYADLVGKLFRFFIDNEISLKPKLP